MYFGPGISVGRRGISYGDSDAQAFISATGLTGTTEVNAVNNLVANLKTYGLWSKMKAIYPFVSDTKNLTSYSEDFTNAYWTKSGNLVITANTTTAPDGTLTADTFYDSGSISKNITVQVGVYYTLSAYFKLSDARYCKLSASDGATGDVYATFDLTNLTVNSGSSGAWSNVSTNIVNAGNGWYRCSVTSLRGSSGSEIIYRVECPVALKTFYTWGLQLEQNSSATTYQPIATTPANRFVSQFKYNLKDPRDLDAAFRLAFNGTWTYSKQGATPNGVNGYADTYLTPSGSLSQNNTHISSYIRNTSTGVLMGCDNTYRLWIAPNLNGSQKYVEINTTTTTPGTPISSATGLWLGNRLASNLSKLFNNTTLNYSHATASAGLETSKVFIGARNAGVASNFTNAQQAFATIGDGLTDTEATNLYTSVQLFQQELSRYVGVPIVSDANAQAFLDAAVITDQTQANAVNTLVTDLKTYGLWTKMKAIYPFVGGTATSHKWNLKDPRDLDAAYRLAFYGAWTHSSTGALPNGTNAYADSFITPSANLNANSTHASYYSRTNVTTNAGTEIGTWYSGYNYGIELNLYRSVAAQKTAAIINSGGGAAQINGGSVTPTTGLLVGSRTSNSNGFVSKNGATIGTNTTTVTTQLSTFKIYLGAANNFGTAGAYSNKESAFASIGDGITESEATTLNTLVTNFETTLGRNV